MGKNNIDQRNQDGLIYIYCWQKQIICTTISYLEHRVECAIFTKQGLKRPEIGSSLSPKSCSLLSTYFQRVRAELKQNFPAER